jgi:hypothetical protein
MTVVVVTVEASPSPPEDSSSAEMVVELLSLVTMSFGEVCAASRLAGAAPILMLLLEYAWAKNSLCSAAVLSFFDAGVGHFFFMGLPIASVPKDMASQACLRLLFFTPESSLPPFFLCIAFQRCILITMK